MTKISLANQVCSWSILILSRPTSAQEEAPILVTITCLVAVLDVVPDAALEEAKFHEIVPPVEALPSLSLRRLANLSRT